MLPNSIIMNWHWRKIRNARKKWSIEKQMHRMTDIPEKVKHLTIFKT